MGDGLNLVDIIAISLVVSQIGMTIFYFYISQASRLQIEALKGDLARVLEEHCELSKRFEETYILGRMLVRWIEVGHADRETLKSVVDELCRTSDDPVMQRMYKDMEGDKQRREELHLAYKRIALCSEDPGYVLSALRFLSQSGGSGEFLLAMRIYCKVEESGQVKFRSRVGWTCDDEQAFLSCLEHWASRLGIAGRNLAFFSAFGSFHTSAHK